jgi:hypothetical protein
MRLSITANKNIKNPAPRKPSSSPTSANMKSVCRSGKNPNWPCVPPNNPFPNNPPDPTAILDWMTL